MMSETHGYHRMLSFQTLKMLCQGFTAAAVAASVWVFPSSGLSSKTEKLLCCVVIRWMTWGLTNILLLWLQKVLSYLHSMLRAIIHLHFEAILSVCRIFWMRAESLALYTSEFMLYADASISSHIINWHQWPSSASNHTCPCHNNLSKVFDW